MAAQHFAFTLAACAAAALLGGVGAFVSPTTTPSLRLSSAGALHLAKKPVLESGRSQFAEFEDGNICYDAFYAEKTPALFYLPCLNRQKNEAKASNLASWCRINKHTFIAADYYGVSRSSGTFQEATLTRWTTDTIRLIEMLLPRRRTLLVGNGVGAWVMMLIAQRRPDLVAGLVGLAADPDFTEDLLWAQLSDDVKAKIMNEGMCDVAWGDAIYPISSNLITDGRKNLLLRGPKRYFQLSDTCPLRLVHGLRDEEVPYTTSLRLAEIVSHDNVVVTLVKGATHSLEEDQDQKQMRVAIEDCIRNMYEYDLTTTASG